MEKIIEQFGLKVIINDMFTHAVVSSKADSGATKFQLILDGFYRTLANAWLACAYEIAEYFQKAGEHCEVTDAGVILNEEIIFTPNERAFSDGKFNLKVVTINELFELCKTEEDYYRIFGTYGDVESLEFENEN